MDAVVKRDLEAIIDNNRLGAYQIAVIVLCALVAMMDGFDTQSIAFVAPEIAAAWKVPAASFGPVFGIGLFGGLIGAMSFGIASDRFGRKPLLLLAVVIFAGFSLATPSAQSIPGLVLCRFLTGLGLGGALPSIIAITSEYAPRRLRATIVGLMFCGFPLGAVVGGIVSAKLIPAAGWQSVFVVGGAAPLILLPVFLTIVPESVRFLAIRLRADDIARILHRMRRTAEWNGEIGAIPTEERSPVKGLFTEGRALGTILLWIALFLSLLLSYFLVNWIPIVARQTGMAIESAVLAVATLNLGSIIGCFVIGRIADQRGPAVIIGVCFACGAVAIAAIGQVGQSSALLLAVTFVAGFFSIGAQLCTVALCASFYETFLRATGVGWSMGVGRVGAIVGPVLGGLLLGAGVGTPTLFVVTGIASLGSALAVLAMGRFVLRGRRRAASDIVQIVGRTA